MPLSELPPEALAPEYTCDINEPIVLYEGEGILSAGGKQHHGHCLIRYTWQPHQGPEVVFQTRILGLDDNYHLEVPAIGLSVPVMGRRAKHTTDKPATFTGMLHGEVRMGQATGLARVSFHLANFPFVFGTPIQRGTLQMRARIHLESVPWAIDIDPVPDPHAFGEPNLLERLSEARGHAITHVGSLTRADGGMFDVAVADEVLRDVARTLGLARAAFSRPILRSGYDAAGTKVWSCWSEFRTDAWWPDNWFSKHHPEMLQSVFAGWRRLATSPNLEVINAAAHLYNDAHTPSLAIESQLVLAQAALEGLAAGWPYPPVPGSPPLTGLAPGAAARIAQLAVSLGLPLTVPASLEELASLPNPRVGAHALEKMTWVRNSIAHLDNFPRLATVSGITKYQARQLAMWHLELAILRLLDANGPYLNRLRSQYFGDVERLPWIPPET